MRTLGAVCLLLACSLLGSGRLHAESPSAVRSQGRWQAQLRADVVHLASDELRGRSVDDDAIHVAADYVAKRLVDSGLRTDLFQGSPFQQLEIPVGARAGAAERNFVRIFRSANAADDPASQRNPADSSTSDSSTSDSSTSDSSTSDSSASDPSTPEAIEIDESLSLGMNPMSIGAAKGDVSAELVFVGYGITADGLGYDDYAGIDVQDKIVAILRKEPGMDDANSRFEGTKTSPHAYFQTKIENAIRHGAAAVILINDPRSIEASVAEAEKKLTAELNRLEAVGEQFERLPEEAENIRATLQTRISGIESMIDGLRDDVEQRRLGVLQIAEAGGAVTVVASKRSDPPNPDPPNPDALESMGRESAATEKKSIPVVSLARDRFDFALQATTGFSLAEIESEIDATYQPHSMPLPGLIAHVSVELKSSNASTANVIGELQGRGHLAGETVVIGAHYDHVGMGGYGSLAPGTVAIHNGADDNASGTSAMLAAASLLVERLSELQSHRRVLFIGFTGEERGLVGSKYYVRHPRYPLDSTVAMINLDMVGRLHDNELTIYGTGTGDGFEQMVDGLNQSYQFNLMKVPSGYGPSDHQSFYEAGVPVLFFFTGLHNDYHRPSDDSDKIDYGGLTRITDMVSDVAFDLATREARPRYAETEKRVQIRRQLTAFMGVSLHDRADHVVISGLTSGGPAERMGLQPGDRLDRLGKKSVRTAVDVLDLLRHRSPGDALKVSLTRNGEPLEIEIRLDARPSG
ncbi:secreted protein containing Peptidase M28 domain protein [Rhodopirellula maiorica SM1]|uniref:Secreted protein containing Peptidase M28 domain protein n=1 Tax=Rhodopirellula maiorica SM1 TaxID=1265738 RepID=M5RTK6_9BACT|nr:M28 family peptidase [Rhodopirellula maiorica]EMI18717.1 secreted protein containing Peptidase M28 domain protein [Rhodopirellula maiorica SM1]